MKRYFTLDEIAERWGCGSATWPTWREIGELRTVGPPSGRASRARHARGRQDQRVPRSATSASWLTRRSQDLPAEDAFRVFRNAEVGRGVELPIAGSPNEYICDRHAEAGRAGEPEHLVVRRAERGPDRGEAWSVCATTVAAGLGFQHSPDYRLRPDRADGGSCAGSCRSRSVRIAAPGRATRSPWRAGKTILLEAGAARWRMRTSSRRSRDWRPHPMASEKRSSCRSSSPPATAAQAIAPAPSLGLITEHRTSGEFSLFLPRHPHTTSATPSVCASLLVRQHSPTRSVMDREALQPLVELARRCALCSAAHARALAPSGEVPAELMIGGAGSSTGGG